MSFASVIGLINNAALLLALGLLYDMLWFKHGGDQPVLQQLAAGLIAGAVGVAIMLNPWDFGQGVLFDTRSVLLSLSGFFFGTVPVVVAVLITGAFRVTMGGSGTWTGVAVIVTSGGIGLAWQYLRRRPSQDPTTGELVLLGVAVHIAMLAWMFLLPRQVALAVLSKISLPVMVIYPLATVILGKLMVNRAKRQHSEAALRESEQKFHNLFHHHSAVKLLIDPDTGRIVDANQAAETFYGWPMAQLQQMRIEDINTLSPEQVRAEMEKVRSLKRIHFEFCHRLADGSVRDVEVYSSKIEIEGKQLLHSVIHDITERKLAEKRLVQSNDLLSNLARLVPGVIYQFRLYPDGRSAFPYASPGMNDIYEYAPEDVREDATPVYGRLHPQDYDHVVAAITESARSLQTFYCEFRVILPRQGLRWRWSQAQPERMDDGGTLWHGIILDVTERKEAEENRRQLADIIEKSLNEIYIFDAQTLKFRYANRGALQNIQYSLEQLKKLTPVDLKPEFTEESFRARVQPLLTKEQESLTFETVHQRADGSRYPAEIHLQLTDAGPDRVFLAVIYDITDRKQAENERNKLQAQLVQAQKMESVGRLAGGVAHDYNNMLSVIIGHTEMALDKVGANDELHTDLEEIMAAARRSADITRQLLAFSRQQTIAPKRLDLNATVESMLKMLRRLIGEDIDLAWHPGARVGPVNMDPTQLDQILVNLCVNARDAIADVGKISIETGTETFDETYCADHLGFVPGDYVLLCVSDDGCGMDKQTQAHLFEPFFTTKQVGKGTGLGLATVYGIVKQNNGFINVYSEPGQGTTFRIYLPRHGTTAEPAPGKQAPPPDAQGSETILLVEDEPTILRMTKIMLQRLGYTVVTAGTPGQAIDLSREHAGRIDLLMTDVVMPEMNGRELAKRLQDRHPGLKVLFMSGYTANVIAHRGVLDEGVNFIQKPFSKKDVAVKIRDVLRGDDRSHE